MKWDEEIKRYKDMGGCFALLAIGLAVMSLCFLVAIACLTKAALIVFDFAEKFE